MDSSPFAADRPSSSGVKSSERTLDVLELLAVSTTQPTLTEMSRILGLPKSSLYKLLSTMERRGWIESDDVTHTRYRIGLRALLAGSRYVDADAIVQLTEPLLNSLSEQFSEATHLGRLEGSDVVYLAKRESTHPLRMYSAVGRRLPAHATAMGKAMLAQRTWDEVDALLPDPLAALTVHTITSRPALRDELERVRERGYAVDDQESADMLRAVAVALPRVGNVANALSISAPVTRLEGKQVLVVAAALQRAAASVSLPGLRAG